MRPTRPALLLATALAALTLAACSSAPPRRALPTALTPAEGFSETGIASWYGHPFHGRQTASGEVYDMEARTAAHKTLPLGTRVRVTSLENGRTVTARINDRGPFVEGRIIDLSRALARDMEMLGAGTMRVRIEALDETGSVSHTTAAASSPGAVAWQVGSFGDPANARRLADRLGGEFGPVRIATATVGGNLYHRVQVGRYTQSTEADEDYGKLLAMGFDPFPVRIP